MVRQISRLARKINRASFFHVIVQGINQENIFQEERYKKEYSKLSIKSAEKYNAKILAYCIMNNHAHFLYHVDEIECLSKLMHTINCSYARYYNYINNGRRGYVFKNRYLSEAITSKRYLINCIKYIHLNPVKAKIVKKCDEYKYSSYNYYKKENFNNKLKENEIFSKEDYLDIINNFYTDYIFRDTEESAKYKIKQGISEFAKKEQINLFEIFSERNNIINLIKFLKNVKKIEYIRIREYLDITRGTMENITRKIRKN